MAVLQKFVLLNQFQGPWLCCRYEHVNSACLGLHFGLETILMYDFTGGNRSIQLSMHCFH